MKRAASERMTLPITAATPAATLAATLLLGAVLRAIAPGLSPPGMSANEAANAWNAYCVLKTGAAQIQPASPFVYFALPFVAASGLGVQGVRWAGAAAGVLALLGIFYVGMRMFGRATGLLAAALFAVMPWSLQLTRWGDASALIPALTLAPLGAVLWTVVEFPRVRWSRAAIAVLVCIGCIAALLPMWRGPSGTPSVSRYLAHFGSYFLLEKGDQSPLLSPPEGYGELLLFMVPMMIAGLVILVKRWRTPAARLLAAWLLLYPVADLMYDHAGPDVIRSAPGLCALTLLAAWGTVETVAALWRASRGAAWVLAVVMGLGCSMMTAAYVRDFFGNFNREDRVFSAFHVDVITATDWLRPRFSQMDTVYLTQQDLPQPWLYAVIGLRYEPQEWFPDRPGKLHFLHGNPAEEIALRMKSTPHGRVVLIARPGEVQLPGRKANALITNGHHAPTLEIFQVAW